MIIVPCDWPHSSVRTTPLSESTAARRVRSANGSRIDGRNSPIASAMCVTSRIGTRVVGIRPIVPAAVRRQGRRSSSSATQSPSSDRLGDAADQRPRTPSTTSASRSTKMPDARSVPPGRSSSCSEGRKRDQDAGDEVGQDDVERRLARRQRLPARASQAADEPVAPGVRRRRLDGDRVGVDAEGRPRAELERGDRQDPRAAADVEDAGPGEPPVVGQRLERREAQPGRRVEAGPEGHARVEREDDVVRTAAVATPRRPDHQPAADAHDREVAPSRPRPSRPPGRSASGARRSCRRPNAWRWPSASATSRGARRSAAAGRRAGTYPRTTAGRVRVDPGAEPLVDEVEPGSTVVPPLATRPRISLTASTASGSASTASSSHAAGVGRAASPQAELVEDAAARRRDRLARLAANASSSSRCFFDSFSGPRHRPGRGGRHATRRAGGGARPCPAAGSPCRAACRV